MPQFLEERFDRRVKTVMAFFWLAVFIFINLTSILYLGALTIENVMGVPMLAGIIGLAAFAGIYSIYGVIESRGIDRCYSGCVFDRRWIDNNLHCARYAWQWGRCYFRIY